jgi:hypothetical protein
LVVSEKAKSGPPRPRAHASGTGGDRLAPGPVAIQIHGVADADSDPDPKREACAAASRAERERCLAAGMREREAGIEGAKAAAREYRVQAQLDPDPPDFYVPPAQRLRFDAAGRQIPPKKARR